MGYTALKKMKVHIPPIPTTINRTYAKEALLFLRDDCQDLKHNPLYANLNDDKGTSAAEEQIPYNMERDLDRLCFERAMIRFLKSGSQEDAFDIYYCYCEIFKPFGEGGDSARLLLKLLSDHEANASSLLVKHRDHYSHAAYVFILGLAFYRLHDKFRAEYDRKYSLTSKHDSAYHFLEYWGMTALFHDIGYPFEIAHQQMKAYVTELLPGKQAEVVAPYISYGNMEAFAFTPGMGNLNTFLARTVTVSLDSYLRRFNADPDMFNTELYINLCDRGAHKTPTPENFNFMDHAYFSALLFARTYLQQHNQTVFSQVAEPVRDCFCAILLHNSLFRFTIKKMVDKEGKFQSSTKMLQMTDGQPLTYLLMLCDELQCWGRSSYGHKTRHFIYPFDFDIIVSEGKDFRLEYYFDETYHDDAILSESWIKLQKLSEAEVDAIRKVRKMTKNKTGGNFIGVSKGLSANKRCKMLDTLNELIWVKDFFAGYEPDTSLSDLAPIVVPMTKPYTRQTGMNLSKSNYLNLYNLAVDLNATYANLNEKTKTDGFETKLSLEYKLSNIAQARRYSTVLKTLNCFYTDRPVDYKHIPQFDDADLTKLARCEHNLWCEEKKGMGWQLGDLHLRPNGPHTPPLTVSAASSLPEATKTALKKTRECSRIHDALVAYDKLDDAHKRTTEKAMLMMKELLQSGEGLLIYKYKK